MQDKPVTTEDMSIMRGDSVINITIFGNFDEDRQLVDMWVGEDVELTPEEHKQAVKLIT